MADGHGGIQTIAKTSTSGLVDTYTITFSDETTSTFTVTNARSISNLTSSKSGKVTTVTITYNDSTTSSFTVRDGENVTSITEYWAISTSGSSQPQSGWQTMPPTMTSTYKYLWHYTLYTYSDGTTSSTTPAVQGVYGDKGDTGNTGTSITSIAKTSTSGLVDTYTVTMSNGTTTTFTVTNGSEIVSIAKTSTAGLVDTYTVTMGSGDTHTFTVTNGRGIISFEQTSGTHAAGTIDVYTITYNDGDTSQIQVYNGANGTGAVSTVAGIGVSGSSGDVPLIIKGYGAPTTATVGQENQLYFDMTGGIMYICIAISGSTYDWRGMSSAVDSAMSTTSANPLQNRVISNKVGVGSLASGFSATNLTDAANELMTNKAEKSAAVSTVTYDSTNHKLTKTINGTTSDVMTVDTTPTDGSMNPITSDAAYDLKGAINDIVLESTGTSTDRTSEIVAMLTNNKKCVLGSGTFYTTGIDMPDGATLIGMGDATVLRKTGSGSYVVKMNKDNTVSNLCIDGNNTVTSTIGTHHGILWSGDYSTSQDPTIQPQNGKLSDLTIKNCDGGGITCNDTGTKRFNNLIASNIAINNCNTGINIPFYSEYHRFTNVDAFECYYGCINNGGNNCFVNCDFSDSKSIGFVIDNSNGDKTNNSHGTCIGCSFNHIANNVGLALSLNGVTNGFTFGNCNIFRGSVEIINSTGIAITDSLFGTSLTITITDSRAIVFSEDTFQAAPTVTITRSPYTYFRNCLDRSTGTFIPESGARIDNNFYAPVYDAYNSISTLATYISGLVNGSVVMVRVASAIASAFFESGTAKPTVCYMLKGGSTNAYFLAITQGEASIGNLNVSTGEINILHDLALASDVSSLSGDVTTLSGNVTSLSGVVNSITTRSISYQYSANAGANTNANLKSLIDADLPSGYTFLAIAGYGSGNSNVVVYSARYANNNYSLGLKNVGTTAVTNATADIQYLCIAI